MSSLESIMTVENARAHHDLHGILFVSWILLLSPLILQGDFRFNTIDPKSSPVTIALSRQIKIRTTEQMKYCIFATLCVVLKFF